MKQAKEWMMETILLKKAIVTDISMWTPILFSDDFKYLATKTVAAWQVRHVDSGKISDKIPLDEEKDTRRLGVWSPNSNYLIIVTDLYVLFYDPENLQIIQKVPIPQTKNPKVIFNGPNQFIITIDDNKELNGSLIEKNLNTNEIRNLEQRAICSTPFLHHQLRKSNNIGIYRLRINGSYKLIKVICGIKKNIIETHLYKSLLIQKTDQKSVEFRNVQTGKLLNKRPKIEQSEVNIDRIFVIDNILYFWDQNVRFDEKKGRSIKAIALVQSYPIDTLGDDWPLQFEEFYLSPKNTFAMKYGEDQFEFFKVNN